MEGQHLDFSINKNTVVISRVRESSLPVIMPPVTITGRVTDSHGVALQGVTVNLKALASTVVTDSLGNYSIIVPDDIGKLVFSFVGFTSMEMSVKGHKSINIRLIEKPNEMSDVVVVGYGTSSKKSLTGSVATIKGDEIKTVPAANIGNTLAGRLPGLIAVNSTGEPGFDASALSIRGFSNMLIIVDGIPNNLNTLDPNEIESISVLKDASASIYGARAGNGVILITTRRGTSGPPKFSFTASHGYQTPTVLNKHVDAATYAGVVNQTEIDAGRPAVYSEEELEKFRNGTDPNYPNTDWQAEVIRKWAPLKTYNLNTYGGNDRIKYFMSLGYVNQGGMLKTNSINYQRYNIRSNIDAKISRDFSVSFDFATSIEKRNSPGSGPIDMRSWNSFASPVLVGVRASFPIYPAHLPDPDKLPFSGNAATQATALADPSISGYTRDNRKNILAQFSLKYSVPFIKGLAAKAAFAYTTGDTYIKSWRKQYNVYKYNYTTEEYSEPTSVGKNLLNESQERSQAITSQLFLNYDRVFGLHKIGAMVVGEFIRSDGNYFNAYREGFISTAIDQLFAGGDLNKNNNGSASQDGRVGYASRLSYNYAGKYLMDANFRYDASARFVDDKQWGLFPGVQLAWLVSEENFMKRFRSLDHLKLRASYGLAGNDYVGNYNFLTGYQFDRTSIFGESPVLYKGIVSKGLANRDLTWEKTATTNLAIEATFLKGLIGFELEWFHREVNDVPGYRSLSLPFNYGATLPQENINSFNDRGFEFLVKHTSKIGQFNIVASGNITWARSRWKHYDEPVYPDDETRERLKLSGQWKNRWFGYEAAGLFQNQKEIDDWGVDQDLQGNATIAPGDIRYIDYNKDGKLDSKDEHVIGRGTTPEVTYGISLAAKFKGFELSMLWQGASNVNAYFAAFTGFTPYARNPMQFEFDHWSTDNTDARFPRVNVTSQNNSATSSYWLQNGKYIRLKTVQFGYNFPGSMLSKVGIDGVRLYVAGFNLITFTKVYFLDPESPVYDGNDDYPQQKVINVGLNLNF